MKAAVIYENGGPDVLRYEDVPDPECPDGCVVIDVEAISIEGGDLLHRAGPHRPRFPTSSATPPRARWPRSAPG
jgi:NADPH:quinone reductase